MTQQDDCSIHWQSKSNYAKFWRSCEATTIGSILLMASPQASVLDQQKAFNYIEKCGVTFRTLISMEAGRKYITDGDAFSARLIEAAQTWKNKFDAQFAARVLVHVAAAKFGISLGKQTLAYFESNLENGNIVDCTKSFSTLVLRETKKVVVIFK